MTREEAIKALQVAHDSIRDYSENQSGSDFIDALEMAISALEQQPCEDAVNRDTALEKMSDYVSSGYAESVKDYEEYSKIICQLPSVTRQTGEWLKHSCYDGVWICSNCNLGSSEFDKEFNFCPNCGADMRGAE